MVAHYIILELDPMSTNNANIIITNAKTKRPMVMKSPEARAWMKAAVTRLELWRNVKKVPCFETPVALSMKVYRKTNSGDLDNYYKGICDALQEARIVRNDKLIVCHRECWVLTDPKRPRYELKIEELPGYAPPLFDLREGQPIPEIFKLPDDMFNTIKDAPTT